MQNFEKWATCAFPNWRQRPRALTWTISPPEADDAAFRLCRWCYGGRKSRGSRNSDPSRRCTRGRAACPARRRSTGLRPVAAAASKLLRPSRPARRLAPKAATPPSVVPSDTQPSGSVPTATLFPVTFGTPSGMKDVHSSFSVFFSVLVRTCADTL